MPVNGSAWSEEEFTAGDGYRWRYRRYQPAQSPRAHVVCIHGIQSHAGWYTGSCTRLAAEGYLVDFLDRRGSGTNPEGRGDTPSWRRLVDDIAEFLAPLRNQNVPIVLVAISWGGKPAVALLRRHPGLVDALALLCPGFCPIVGPTLWQRLNILWTRIRQPGRIMPIPLDDPQLFTATPRWQEFLRTDPLALHQASARFLVESARLDGYLRFAVGHVRLPVLLLLAGRDRVINNGRTRRLAGRFPTSVEIHEYPEAHHTLEFEPDPRLFLDDLVGWLTRVSSRPRA
jgi:alpha-beta hydrolase superfamily lysophospholipase